MEGDFTLNKLGWYTVQNVAPNDFINESLENNKYGVYYDVKFEGDADTFLWLAKTAPEPGQKVYGHLEESKSGKSVKFRRAKKEDTPQEASSASPANNQPSGEYWDDKNATIRAQWAIGQAVQVFINKSDKNNIFHSGDIEGYARTLYAMVDRVTGGSESTGPKAQDMSAAQSSGLSTTTTRGTTDKTSGYDKFKASRPKRDEDAEAQSLYQTVAMNEVPEAFRGDEMPEDFLTKDAK